MGAGTSSNGVPKSIDGKELKHVGVTDGKDAEVTSAWVKRYQIWLIVRVFIYLGLAGWAIGTLFRYEENNCHVEVTRLRIRNIGDAKKLEHERLDVADVPIVYSAILVTILEAVLTFIQLPFLGLHLLHHTSLNKPLARSGEFVVHPIDPFSLFENAVVWPFGLIAFAQITGVTDWQWLVTIGVLAYFFGLYITQILSFRETSLEIITTIPAVLVLAVSLTWGLVDTMRAAHETAFPDALLAYAWIFLILTVIFVLVVFLVRQHVLTAGWLIIYTNIFHLAIAGTLTIACFAAVV